jgi:Domain of unknown function (DUF4224)
MTTLLLSREEVADLTGRTQHAAQARVLRGMGIEHRVRPDGSIAVARAHFDSVFGGAGGGVKIKKTEPDFAGMRNP